MATWEIEYRVSDVYTVTVQASNPGQALRIFEKYQADNPSDDLGGLGIKLEVSTDVIGLRRGVDEDVQAWEERNIA